MREEIYTVAYDRNHIHFGGNVSDYSFNGHTTLSDMAKHIMNDLKFDEDCKRDAMTRDKYNKVASI